MNVPPPSIHVTLRPERLTEAFAQWAKLRARRGRSAEGIPRKMMQYWISFALNKIRQGDSAKIEADLMGKMPDWKGPGNARQRRGRKRQMALAAKYEGTVAAYLVRVLNWQGARTAKRKDGSPAFYGMVGKFIGARKWSRNLHRAGFYPVIQKLRAENKGYLPKPKRMPGTYSEQFVEGAATLIAQNMASAAQRPGGPAPLGIAGLAPDALDDAKRQMVPLIEGWLKADEEAAARQTGAFSIQ